MSGPAVRPPEGAFDCGLGSRTRLACRECGAIYDPALGDPARRVPPGIAFARLPENWTCPGCGEPPHRFGPVDRRASDPVSSLLAGYRTVAAEQMAGVAIVNPALSVEGVGFQPCEAGRLGCVVAPWFLNAVLLPDDPGQWAGRRDGDAIELTLPSGKYRFTAARFGALGTLAVIPLVSDMVLFATQEQAREAAQLALDTLLEGRQEPSPPPAPPPAPPDSTVRPRPELSRRALFGRGAG